MLTPYDLPPLHPWRGLPTSRAAMGLGGLALTILACLTMNADSLLVMLLVIHLAGLAVLMKTLVRHTKV